MQQTTLPKQLDLCGTNILTAAATGGVVAMMDLITTSSTRCIRRVTSLPFLENGTSHISSTIQITNKID